MGKGSRSAWCGEILLTSIERGRRNDGYDVSARQDVSAAVKIPVIASGGLWQL